VILKQTGKQGTQTKKNIRSKKKQKCLLQDIYDIFLPSPDHWAGLLCVFLHTS